MSLLIKALNKAEEAQAKNSKTEQAQAEASKKNQAGVDKLELTLENEAGVSNKTSIDTPQHASKSVDVGLSLSPGSEYSNSETISANVSAKPTNSTPVIQASAQQLTGQQVAAKSAANVFSAKSLETKTTSTRLIIISGAGLIVLLGMGLYYYQFVDTSQPALLPPRPFEQIATTSPQVISAENLQSETSKSEATASEPSAAVAVTSPAIDATEIKPKSSGIKNDQTASVDEDQSLVEAEGNLAEESSEKETVLSDERLGNDTNRFQASFSANNATKKTRKSRSNAAIASESTSFSVTKSTSQPSVNPALMSAYEAYKSGKDAEAQKLYKQVLKNDIGNVDALLGLGAIATKQGRIADANGWYGKVLEVEPRNSIAKTALLNSNLTSNQPLGNEVSNETSLKNMLAKQPDDANLHVALGNLYAEQNQWPAAQQAYFEAYSLNKTTDNAYNLAISLDQMGKPKLALPYYIQALQQATDEGSIDKVALQARINAIQ